MKIDIYAIAKSSSDIYDKLCSEFDVMSLRFAKIQTKYIFDNKIAKAQNVGAKNAQAEYSRALSPYLDGFNIALDPSSRSVDSIKFSKLLESKTQINFFIGGAYGFDGEFIRKCDASISLSDLTMSHKVAKVVLHEQIFRGLCILNNHPYHK